DGGGTDMQHTSGIPNATGVHRHVDDLLLDGGGVTGVAVLQQESASVAYRLLATIALLALAGLPMADDIDPVAVRAMQDLHNHAITQVAGGCSASHTPGENSRPTPLKHPPVIYPVHGSKTTAPVCCMCGVLRVASVRPATAAVAANNPSSTG